MASEAEATTVADAKPGLTPDQLRGVRTVGRSLLMSAAAGSGKTRVLAERCAYLVCDAEPPFRCDVDELLVVTFTEAAAAEMRDRIGRAVEARAAADPADPRLARQRVLLDQASVSTLHSFCAQLLRQHFHLVGLDPAFAVMDEHEGKLLRLDIGRAMFRDRYAGALFRPEGESQASYDARSAARVKAFQDLLDDHFDGDDERLLAEVFRLHDLLGSLVDPEAWKVNAVGRIEKAAEAADLTKAELGEKLVEAIRDGIKAVGVRCNAALDLLAKLGGFDPYVKRVEEVRQICRFLYSLVGKAGIDAVVETAQETKFDRLPAVSNSVANKELAKDAVDGVTKEFKEGGWRTLLNFDAAGWQAGLKLVLPHVEALLSLVDEFDGRYRQAKDESRQIDFADLERYALAVLLTDPTDPRHLEPSAVARHYHRAFKHVLVDEYQDINELQNAILFLVSHECLGGKDEGGRVKDEGGEEGLLATGSTQDSSFGLHPSAFSLPPNLFCVGDVKQSIYRFRLADPGLFLKREQELRERGGDGEVIDLRQNFRSRGPLLEAINVVFSRLMTREAVEIEYDATQRLVPGRVFADAGGAAVFPGAPIELHVLPRGEDDAGADGPAEDDVDDGDAGWDRTEREAAFVAGKIWEMVGKDGSAGRFVYDRDGAAPRPARFEDMVILLRSKRYKAGQFVRILESFGIPTHAETGSGFFESTEIRDVLALLCLLNNGAQDLELAAYLRSPLARLDEPEDAMAEVRLAYPGDDKGAMPFHEAVTRYAAERQGPLAERLRTILADLAKLREYADRSPAADTVWHIYHRTGYLAYVTGLPGGDQRAANLTELYDRARRFGTHRRQGLARFNEYLNTLEAEADVGTPSVSAGAGNVVRIMTVHASKGLEFPIVFLPDCGKRVNLRDEAGAVLLDQELGIGMPAADRKLFARYPSLAQVLVKSQIHKKAMAEELRVLYVALTRAMEHLVLIGTADAKTVEGWTSRWAGHDGPLPASAIAGAKTVLDWVGPVWAADGDRWITLRQHASDELAEPPPRRDRQTVPGWVEAIRSGRPVEPAAVELGADVRAVVDRLSYAYPQDRLTKRAAAASVTSRAKTGRPAAASILVPVAATNDGEAADATAPGATAVAELPLPSFGKRDGQRPTSSDVGTAVHEALRHLRFADAADEAAIGGQLDAMLADRKLTAEQRTSVSAGDLLWLVTSDLGRLLVAHEPRLLREMPVYFAADPDGSTTTDLAKLGLDAIMVRGRVDLFVPLPGGGIVVDYKTDRVGTDAEVAARAAAYAEQLRQYAEAIGRIAGEPVSRRCLVFLRARRVVEV